MQSTLKDASLSQPSAPGTHHPFSGGVWSSQPWLLAAATISTVILVTFSIWQRREINQLRQTIGQLKTSPAHQSSPTSASAEVNESRRSDVAQAREATPSASGEAPTSANRNASQAVRPDTVYITRYVAPPSQATRGTRMEEHLTQRQPIGAEQKQVTEIPTLAPSIAHQSDNAARHPQTESYDASSTSPVAKDTYSEPMLAEESNRSLTKQKRPISRNAGTSGIKQRRSSSSNSVPDEIEPATDKTVAQPALIVAANQPSVRYESVISRPLTLPKKNWSVSLAQRARRMQPAQPVLAAVEPTSAPASQPVKSMAARFRAGVSGEVASRLWSVGVYTELLVGKHLTVGVGLNEATYLNRFITEDDFNGRTQRDFRREFARGVNAWGEIINIDTRQVRFQVPVNLGYRIPLNQSLALLTSVGTYVNLTSAENVTYYCRQPLFPPMKPQLKGELTEVEASKSQPVALINSFSLGAGIEWQRSHWAVQATPVLTIPTQTDPRTRQTDLNWQQNVIVGMRARLLYQF